MFYINQLCTPSFPIGLVKTESGFIVRWVETGLGRWMLMVAVISVDAYSFLAFSDLTCCLQDTVVLVPCLCMEVRPYSFLRWCGYFWGPWVSFITTDEFSVRVTKITLRIGVSWTHSLPFYFLTYLNLMNYDHIIKIM